MTAQTGPQAKSLSYDFLGMPVSITAGDTTQHYFYGADNFRVATYTEEASAITRKKVYVYEEGLKVAKEIRDDGSSVKTLVHLYGRDELVGLMDEETGARRLMVKDHQGSVVQVVDGNGQAQDETFFGDYGEQAKKVGTSDALNPCEGWTGKEFDDAIGLTYFGARFYDPEFGMWLTPDLAAEFFSPYSYVGGDPINLVDPFGLQSDSYPIYLPGNVEYLVGADPNQAGAMLAALGGSQGGTNGGSFGGGFVGVQATPMFTFTVQTGPAPTVFNTPEQPGMSGLDALKLAVVLKSRKEDIGSAPGYIRVERPIDNLAGPLSDVQITDASLILTIGGHRFEIKNEDDEMALILDSGGLGKEIFMR